MSEAQTSTELVVQPATGEPIDVRAASTEQLAQAVVESQDTRTALREFEEALGTECLDRLDREACWTLRVGDPTDTQWELKAPSPTAGTEVYPEYELVRELRRLIADGLITPEGASRACERSLNVKLSVPWDADPQEIADLLKGELVKLQIAGHEMAVLSATPQTRSIAAGIKALRKVPGVSAVLDSVLRVQEQGPRRVSVKLKTKARS
jgi:hypothetical protein